MHLSVQAEYFTFQITEKIDQPGKEQDWLRPGMDFIKQFMLYALVICALGTFFLSNLA
jgi:hypothetical protein